MLNEFLSTYRFLHLAENVQRQGIDYLLGRDRPPAGLESLAHVADPLARLDLLAQALLTAYKDYARAGSRREPGGLPQLYRSQGFQTMLEQRRQQLAALGLLPGLPDLTSLPACSFGLHFTFALRTPYLSRDDTDWHILDNPVKKEWVFKLPYVAPSQWKGALRAAMRQERGYTSLAAEQQDEQMIRLFGNVKGEDREEAFCAGCLHFYPTYFDQIGLEVINPHPRDTGAGQQPIYLECVPAGAEGTFTLLYVPLVETGPAADLLAVAQGVRAMMTVYGFGAKTSSGYGAAEERFVQDEQGQPQAHLRAGRTGYRCRSFTGLGQAAARLAETLAPEVTP